MNTYCELQKGNIKRGFTNRRSYVGYYNTTSNMRYYLRSKIEFVVARWLDLAGINFKYEAKTFSINGVNYKPDFFHIVHGKIRTIIEVKPDKKTALLYYQSYNSYFKELGIRYVVV